MVMMTMVMTMIVVIDEDNDDDEEDYDDDLDIELRWLNLDAREFVSSVFFLFLCLFVFLSITFLSKRKRDLLL